MLASPYLKGQAGTCLLQGPPASWACDSPGPDSHVFLGQACTAHFCGCASHTAGLP